MKLLEDNASQYFLALCDLNLPDAPNGEIVPAILALNIPVVVVSAHFDEDIYKRLMLQGVTDYIVKRTPDDMMYLMRVVRRLRANSGVAMGGVNPSDLGLGNAGAVPEPATWAMLIAGFGLVGAAMRRRRRDGIRSALA